MSFSGGLNFHFDQQKPHLSTKLASDLIRYVRATSPNFNFEEFYNAVGLSEAYIFNEDKWLSVETFKRAVEKIIELTGDPDLPFKAGQFSVRNPAAGKTIQFLLKNVVSMSLVYSFLPKLATIFNQVTKIQLIRHENGRILLRLEPDFQRQNLSTEEQGMLLHFFDAVFQSTLGYLTAIPVNYQYPPAQASFEKLKTADGTPYYEISVDYPKPNLLNRASILQLLVVTGLIFVVGAFLLDIVSVLPFIITSFVLAFLLFSVDLARTKSRLKDRFESSLAALETYDQRYTKLHQAHLDNEKLLVSYKKFVPFEYLRLLKVNDIFNLKLGQAVQEKATLLFCDIRNFTSISEQLTPAENFEFLNRYFEKVAPLIQEEGGFIDKYIGDELLAIFPPNSGRAIIAAQRIHNALEFFSLKTDAINIEKVEVGIGIATGQVMIGTLGVDQHMQVTVISDAVNIASRLQQLTKEFKTSILACGETIKKANAVQSNLPARYLGDFYLRGKAASLPVFEIFPNTYATGAKKAMANRKLTDSAISLIGQGRKDLSLQLFQEASGIYPDDPLIIYYLRHLQDSSTPLLLQVHGQKGNPSS